MFALIVMAVSLFVLVVLLRFKVPIGRAMVASAVIATVVLRLSPREIMGHLSNEFETLPLSKTSVYLFIMLSALVMLVNVLGAAMRHVGVANRLIPAMQGLFRSRRVALAIIPFIMGMLPTPGGIMLSAPMVRELGDSIGVDRAKQAAINFFFRHQWEPIWPLFPAIPLIQGILGVSVRSIIACNAILWAAGTIGGVIFLLIGSMPPKSEHVVAKRSIGKNLKDFAHAFWPIVLATGLYAAFELPPAIGVLVAVIAFLILHRVKRKDWIKLFKTAGKFDFVLLIFGAVFFKFALQASSAINEAVTFLNESNVPPSVVVFLLPFIVAVLTGITAVTVAITFPFLAGLIGTGDSANMPLEVLAFAGVMTGLYITPIHLCLPLSSAYFETPLGKIIARLIPPALHRRRSHRHGNTNGLNVFTRAAIQFVFQQTAFDLAGKENGSFGSSQAHLL